jgi:hypothetical protein
MRIIASGNILRQVEVAEYNRFAMIAASNKNETNRSFEDSNDITLLHPEF